MLLSKAWASFVADKRIEGFSPQTLKAYQLQSSLIIDYFNDVEMTLMDTYQLKEYLAITCKHLKPASLALRIMKSFFRWSHEKALLVRIQLPKLRKRIPKYLTEREIEHLRESCQSPIEKAIFEFMFSTGCRIGEIVALDKNHINWSNQSATIYSTFSYLPPLTFIISPSM
ncbi:tyrosine-type recombinase/integrase [Psychrobacillus sp. NEAU-3TGS]|nr:tyrosine-type recombinase/integrase [Psychrobacillus sp. NEAU-3TGS]